VLGEEVVDAYLDRAASVPAAGTPRALDVVYTPLHGVGRDVVLAAFVRAGFPAPYVVPDQGEPDPRFPTVSFPNPEEPGAMDLAFAAATERGADIVLANDPDADRCAAGVRTGDGWRMLRGDEVGALLAAHLLARGERGTYATTIVSSSLLGKMAERHGAGYVETLTGFKWLARVDGLRYAYEEAIGYCVDPAGVRDKDGISAALLLAEVAAGAKAQGRTLLDLLDDLADTYGVHATDQLSFRVADLSLIDAAMARVRSDPPRVLGGRDVIATDDLSEGSQALPPTDALRFTLDGGGRVVVRPSGTEPKLKCYLEVVVGVPASTAPDRLAVARAEAAEALERIAGDLAAALGL
jgi:phosphomannomutase